MTATMQLIDNSFGGNKAAPFAKGGGRKKSAPNDAHGRTKKAKAKKVAAKLRGANVDNSITPAKARKKARNHALKLAKRLDQADLAITPGGRVGDASPLGKPGSKRKLSDYEREVAHALMRKRGIPRERAIPMARGIINNWSQGRTGKGKGRVSPAVVVGANKSIAQRSSFSNETTIDNTPHWRHGWIPVNAEAVKIAAGDTVRERPLGGRDAIDPQGLRDMRKRHGVVTKVETDAQGVRKATVNWGDKTSLHRAVSLEKKIRNQVSLANEADLAEHVPGTPNRYRHGWIPVASAAKYHSPEHKAQMSQKMLREHANLHSAAIGRARTSESKRKHREEVASSLGEINRRKAAKAPAPKAPARRRALASDATERVSPEGKGKGLKEPKINYGTATPKKKKKKAKFVSGAPDEDNLLIAEDEKNKEAVATKAITEKPSAISKLDPKELTRQLKVLNAKEDKTPADKRRLTQLNNEKVKRVAAVKALSRQAREAAKLVDKSWPDGKEPLRIHNQFLAKLVRVFPSLRAKLSSLRNEDGTVKGKDTILTVLDETVRELSRRLAGPIIGSGLGMLGLHILAVKSGGG